MRKTVSLVMILVLMLLSVMSAHAVMTWDDLTEIEKKEMFALEQTYTPLSPKNPLASSSVNPIVVNDPFAAPGIPVLVEFTLMNRGTEFPFNQISLPADTYALTMAVDREVGFRTESGSSINILEKMTGIQKFMFITGLGVDITGRTLVDQATGATCQFVDVFNNLPKATQEYVISKNGGKRPDVVPLWDCLRISNQATFEERIQEQCEDDNYNSACLAEINKRDSNAILPSVVVALVSDVPAGKCEQARGKTTASWIAKNVIKCGIGENGLPPGSEVTLKFVITVPSDTPVLSDQDVTSSADISEQSFTYSASCLKSQYPKACHTVYAGVYPMATDNVLSVFVDGTTDLFKIGGCGLNKLWYGSNTDFEACVEARATSIDVVGDPLYEGQGQFYVLGPKLDARITLIMIVFALAGFATPGALFLGR